MSIYIIYFTSQTHTHTCCLDRVAAVVVERRRRDGGRGVGARRAAAALHSLKQRREPHPQAVVTERDKTNT